MNEKDEERSLNINDLVIHENIQKGTVIQKDTTCDSKFMLETVREVGEKVQESYKWINEKKIIYLVVDNAGGHGTMDMKKEYVRILMDEFCIQVIWQIANSPDTNMLDLGAWMSIQSQVESIH